MNAEQTGVGFGQKVRELLKGKTFWFVIGLLALLFWMFSYKTMTIEEEVLLNTGETITVYRSVPYALDLAFKHRSINRDLHLKFSYRGTSYEFQEKGIIQLLAISPEGKPNVIQALVGYSIARGDTQEMNCIVPHYLQSIPDASGRVWEPKFPVESWAYHLPTNLASLASLPLHWPFARKIYMKDKPRINAGWYAEHSKDLAQINPTFKSNRCRERSLKVEERK